jgi:hypothetical protein
MIGKNTFEVLDRIFDHGKCFLNIVGIADNLDEITLEIIVDSWSLDVEKLISLICERHSGNVAPRGWF